MVKFCGNLTWYTALTTSWNPITNQFRLDEIHTAMYPRYCMLSVQGIENSSVVCVSVSAIILCETLKCTMQDC